MIFFDEALPGYEEVGRRRILLGCWGSFQNPHYCDYTYKNMTQWGRHMFVTPGVAASESGDHRPRRYQPQHPDSVGQFVYDDWEEGETFADQGSARQSGGQAASLYRCTIPKPQKRDFSGKYTWVMLRWHHKGEYLALDTEAAHRVLPYVIAKQNDRRQSPLKGNRKTATYYLPKDHAPARG